MDGNVKRVFCRYFGVYGATASAAVERTLWSLADQIVQAAPKTLNMTAYTQA